MEKLHTADPQWIGPYELTGRLGAGGMGVVYLGRSPGGRAVAVKVVKEHFAADAEYRARFRREVGAARSVTGTFTAPVLDADPDPEAGTGAPWLVTAYLPGLSLREAVAAFGALPPAALRMLAGGLAEALADIHRAGIAHRDLKPGNIMLTTGGPRVIDFGIARPQDATVITRVTSIIGTPGFMAPEQLSGGAAGPAGDIFSLGAVLLYAASGREPFGAADTATTRRDSGIEQANLGGIRDSGLHAFVTACLRQEPDQRPTATDLLDLLHASRPSHPSDAADVTETTAPVREAAPSSAGWLPAALAEAIDRSAEEARDLPGLPARAAPEGHRITIPPVGAPLAAAETVVPTEDGQQQDREPQDGQPHDGPQDGEP
ncbi:serine/threonine-protein kinase, partial [Streptomyces sp. 150FB]|uniref:serine/threonine-protein kinase n=1 Tax=Streptomyces sp. 150FB TaxID=1576605 RepID=UPI001364A022